MLLSSGDLWIVQKYIRIHWNHINFFDRGFQSKRKNYIISGGLMAIILNWSSGTSLWTFSSRLRKSQSPPAYQHIPLSPLLPFLTCAQWLSCTKISNQLIFISWASRRLIAAKCCRRARLTTTCWWGKCRSCGIQRWGCGFLIFISSLTFSVPVAIWPSLSLAFASGSLRFSSS